METESLKEKTKIGLYWKFFEQFATYGMQFAVGIVMARLLTPEDFGISALPAVFLAVAQIFVGGGFGLALIRKPEITEKDLSTAFYYSLVVGGISFAVLFFSAPAIADFYSCPVLKNIIRVTALIFFLNPITAPQSIILSRRINFKTPARVAIVNKIVAAGVGISIAYLGFGVWALVIASLVASFLGAVQLCWAVRWIPRERFSMDSFRYLWGFGNKMMAVGVLQTVYANVIPMVLGKAGGAVDLGNFNRARGFASLPSSNLTDVISAVTFPVLSKIQSDGLTFESQYRLMIRVSSFVVFPIMTIMAAMAHPMVIVLITEKWEPCVILLQIMCFTYMFQPMQILNLNLLQVMGRTDLSLRLEIIKKVVFFVVILIAVHYGLVVLCVVDFFLTVFALFLNTHYTAQLINVGLWRQLRDVMPAFLMSIVACGISLFVSKLFQTPMLSLAIGGVVGMAFYLVGALAFNQEELKYVRYMLRLKGGYASGE